MAVKLGIVGCGKFANNRVIPAINSLNGCQLVGLQNRSLEKGKVIASFHGVDFYTQSERDLIFHPQIDAIIICSPHYMHGDHLRLCAEKKLPVLCEKPLARSYKEYLNLIEFFPKDVSLLIGQCYRFKHSLIESKKWISEKRIGNLLSMDFKMHIPVAQDNWRYQKRYGGGVLLDMGIHLVDIIHFLIEKPIVEVKSVAHFLNDSNEAEVDVFVKALCQMENGALFSFSCAFNAPYETSFTCVGTKGAIKGEYTFRQAQDEKETLSFISLTDEKQSIPFKRNDIYKDQIQHFLSVIKDKKQSFLSAEKMEQNYLVLNKIRNSFEKKTMERI